MTNSLPEDQLGISRPQGYAPGRRIPTVCPVVAPMVASYWADMYYQVKKIPLGNQSSSPYLTFSTKYNFVSREELDVNDQYFESFYLATDCTNTKTGLARKVGMRTRD